MMATATATSLLQAAIKVISNEIKIADLKALAELRTELSTLMSESLQRTKWLNDEANEGARAEAVLWAITQFQVGTTVQFDAKIYPSAVAGRLGVVMDMELPQRGETRTLLHIKLDKGKGPASMRSHKNPGWIRTTVDKNPSGVYGLRTNLVKPLVDIPSPTP